MTTILIGDCLQVMPTLPENSIDSIITDPPYGLDFMGKSWDHGVPGVEFWQAALRVAKPGAILMAFGGTRTFHRLACAIEDAGWELRDTMCWLYGSGFPKSLDISKAIDKAAGAEREVIGQQKCGTYKSISRIRMAEGYRQNETCATNEQDVTIPATDSAKLWFGYGTALKPAWEPIIVAMKPLEGTYAENAQKWGVAGLWIDGGRIPTGENASQSEKVLVPSISGGVVCDSLESWRDWLLHMLSVLRPCSIDGTIHEHSSDGQDGKLLADALCDALQGFHSANATWCDLKPSEVLDSRFDYQPCLHFCDGLVHQVQVAAQEGVPSLVDVLERICRCLLEPSRSRDIDNDHLSNEDVSLCILALCRLLYSIWYPTPQYTLPSPSCQAKGRFPANLLLDEESARLLDEQSGVSKSTGIINRWKDGAKPFGGGAGHPYESVQGVADSGGASRFFYTAKASSSERNAGLEDSEAKRDADRVRDDGVGGDNPRNRSNTPKQNFHPTVKPVDLMRYLCKLTRTPTGGVVLDPFMGSGTTGIACILEHRDFIGIEIDEKYAEIARRRIDDTIGPLFMPSETPYGGSYVRN